MQKSAIKLTNHQLKLAEDTSYPLTKILIMDQFTSLFAECAQYLQSYPFQFGSVQLVESEYKITKGENFKGLPYLVLDYPKIQSKSFPVLMRTIFWWGKYFSLNMYLHDDLNIAFKPNWKQNELINDVKILMSDDLWQHDLEEMDYEHISKVDINKKQSNYLKLCKTVPINAYGDLQNQMKFYTVFQELQ